MRVATVVPLPPGPRGGVEDYAYGVVRELRGRADAQVVAPCAPIDRAERLEGVDCRLVPAAELFRRRLPRRGPAIQALEEVIRDADIVHVHMPAPRMERWAAELAGRQRTPLVVTYHMDALYDSGRLDARPGFWGEALQLAYDHLSAMPTLDRSAAIVTNAAGYGRDSRLLRGYGDRLRVVQQGVDPIHVHSMDHGAAMRQRLLPQGGRLVVFLGRLVPYKGIPYLLDALRRLDRGDVTLAIAGSGPLRSYIEELAARRGQSSRVMFLGFVPDGEVADLLSAADLVACPSVSLAESTPIVLLEAIGCGTPIVGTKIGGSEESLADDGILGKLVQPRDADALAWAIESLLVSNPWNPERRPGNARTWRDVADDYLAIYKGLLSA